MAQSMQGVQPQQYLRSLRRYVLTPVDVAREAVAEDLERTEAERDAFEQFAERVETVETERPPSSTRTLHAGESRSLQRVRSAYRETVMQTDHYRSVYGEPLLENAAVELGAGIAHELDSNDRTAFTPRLKRTVSSAANRCVDDRIAFRAHLEAERESLRCAHDDLTDLVSNLDGTSIPEWYRAEFADRLDRIATTRQEALRKIGPPGDFDGHDLCEYLYGSEGWTYPVLLSVGRLRESVRM